MDENPSITKEILKSLYDLIKDQEHAHSIWSKVLAAFWGSTVFHFALLSNKLGNLSTGLDKILEVIGYEKLSIIIILYSLTFGLTGGCE